MYRKRAYDEVLAFRLESKGAVLIEGPKWCGKTTTARQQAASAVLMQDPRTRDQNKRLAEIAPQTLLSGSTPRLIDEWQVAPRLWDAIRYEVDERDEFGQFILTGSTVPTDFSEMEHSGTGRISRMRMRPMALFESGDSTGAVSLRALFKGEPLLICQAEDDFEKLAFLTCRGGWPKAVDQSDRVALQQAFDYLDAVVESDISRFDGVKRSSSHARALMRAYARAVSSQGTFTSLQADMGESGAALGESALRGYLDALRSLFVIEDLEAWNPNLRSKTAIRTTPTRHFADPSIATAALGASPSDLINDLNTFGLVFESLCIRDLRACAAALDGAVYHYRDKAGLECDAILKLRNGSYGLIEIKLGGDSAVEEGAKTLKELAAKIDTSRMASPSFLMVLTGTGQYSYPREDGVLVVPIRVLGV